MSLHQSFARTVVGSAFVLLLPAIGILSASAAPRPCVEVVFTRGTFEPSGIGAIRRAFDNAARPHGRHGFLRTGTT
jgi:cutinase